MQLTVVHDLNVHFVDAESSATDSFDRDGVRVSVGISTGSDATAFASISCSGSVEITQPERSAKRSHERAGDPRLVPGFPFLMPYELDPTFEPYLVHAWERIEATLEQVGAVIRWRFGLSGRDAVFKDARAVVTTDEGEMRELQSLAQAAMGDDRAAIGKDGLSEVFRLVNADVREPLAHQLWREAWNLRHANPRSALIIGVVAAEVGLKQLIATLVPEVGRLVMEMPSPPLARMVKNSLQDLTIRAAVERDRRSPRHLLKALETAAEERNDVVHQGVPPQLDLRSTLMAVREFLYLLDYYAGYAWALARLSDATIAALGIRR